MGITRCYYWKVFYIGYGVMTSDPRHLCGSRAFCGSNRVCIMIVVTSSSVQCGVRSKGHIMPDIQYIVNGQEAEPHSWPWMCRVRRFNMDFCGCSIVNRYWVITAAHCVYVCWSLFLHQRVQRVQVHPQK